MPQTLIDIWRRLACNWGRSVTMMTHFQTMNSAATTPMPGRSSFKSLRQCAERRPLPLLSPVFRASCRRLAGISASRKKKVKGGISKERYSIGTATGGPYFVKRSQATFPFCLTLTYISSR
jgi:hypothetical protein